MDSNEKIRQIIQKIMINNGLTYSEMSRRENIGDDTLWKFLKCQRNLTLNYADKLLACCGLEIGIRRKQNG